MFQARLLSAVFGTLAIVFLYLLAEYLFDRRTALLASLLLGISQLGIMFSQEVRPYAQFHFLALCTAYLFLRAFREGRPPFWWSFVASAILMLYTDYFSLYLILALMMLPLIDRGASRLRLGWVLSGGALMLLSFLPWLTSGILHAAATANKTFMGKEAYAAVHWWTLVSIVNSFNNGKPAGLRADSPWWSYVVGGLLFSVPLLWLLPTRRTPTDAAARRYRQNVVFAALLCVVPVLLPLMVGRILQIPYNVRYVSFCAAFYYILVACALFEVKWQSLRWTVVALIVLYSANALRANYLLRWKEHWTEAFAYVQQNHQPPIAASSCRISWFLRSGRSPRPAGHPSAPSPRNVLQRNWPAVLGCGRCHGRHAMISAGCAITKPTTACWLQPSARSMNSTTTA